MSEYQQDDFDQELLVEFIDEALDGLSEVADLFVELEHNPTDSAIIQAIFRPVHSIKGNAAFFGLMKTKALSHEMESILDLIRKNALHPTSAIISILLLGIDELNAMLLRARQRESEVTDSDHFESLLADVKQAAMGGRADESALWQQLLTTLKCSDNQLALDTAMQLAELSTTGAAVLAADQQTEPTTTLPAPLSALQTIFAAEKPANPEDVARLSAELRELPGAEQLTPMLDEWDKIVGLLQQSIGLDDQMARITLNDMLDKLLIALPSPEAAEQEPPPPSTTAEDAPKAEPGAKGKPTGRTMRVSEESIDSFLGHVGDLVTVGEMYQHMHENLKKGLDNHQAAIRLRRVNEAFNALSHSLQTSIMNIRKVPMSSLLQRAPRIIRDVASSSGKNIKSIIIGSDILVDKSLIDTLESPLMHMTRNAADHGIELPEDRLAAGKPEQGLISITVSELPDTITLTIEDDGAGLNREALTEKARKMNLISSNAHLSDDDMVNLLFCAGVSTAETITDISGRGVGMDVVKSAIETMGGRITVSSQPGQGSTFSVQLPKKVSTQILTGFIVLVQGQRYIIPLERILRSFRPLPDAVSSVQNRQQLVNDGKNLLRVCRLSTVFGLDSGPLPDLDQGILVVINSQTDTLALFVDAIEGVRQVVLKPIAASLNEERLFQGSALMGDGTLAMILDTNQIAAYQLDSE